MRCLTVVIVVLVGGVGGSAAGCSQLLGLAAPSEARDASPGGGGGDGGSIDAAPGDFTLQLARATARVPAGSFDFIDVTIARGAGNDLPIQVDVPQPPAGVTTMAAMIAGDATTGHVRVTGDASLAIGSAFTLDVVASDGMHTHDVMVPTHVTGIPGTLDPTFGSNGTGVVDIPLGTLAGSFTGLAVNPVNDDAVAAGTNESSLGSAPALAIVGSNGAVVISTGDVPCSCPNADGYTTVAIGTNRIFAVGQSETSGGDQPFVSAFTNAGALDKGFDFTQGDEFYAVGSLFTAVAIDATDVMLMTDADTLMRIPQAGGSPDPAWHGGTPISLTISAQGPQAIAVDSGQHVYAVGTAVNGDAAVERFTEGGAADVDFGSAGVVTCGVIGNAAAAVVQPDHRVVAAGSSNGTVVVFRVLPAGGLDPSFGVGGVATPALPVSGVVVVAMALQDDGKLVVAGNASGTALLVRYLPDGELDPTFGNGGVAVVPAGQSPVFGGVAVQSTGMLVVTGGNADTPHSNGVDGNGMFARVWF
jgi:uncharacterized delta-60 repeat protein|nr:hypothetical protein [Kofleriaceae bacterium]